MKNKDKKLRFYAVDGKQIERVESIEKNLKRFVGYKKTLVDIVKNTDKGLETFQVLELIKKTDPEEVKYDEYYIKAAQQGDLEPADQETADLCRMKNWIDLSENEKTSKNKSLKKNKKDKGVFNKWLDDQPENKKLLK